jgi:hypothetical protein
MPKETRHGLSPEQFVAQVQASGSVVKEWPFSRMRPAIHYAKQYRPVTVNLDAPPHSKALVIGQVHAQREFGDGFFDMRVSDSPTQRPYHLEFVTDDTQVADAWGQLTGVNIALAVELGDSVNRDAPGRDATITRILGVEQPIRTQRIRGYGRGFLNDETGYIQGTVVRDTIGGHSYVMDLDMDPRMRQAAVVCSYPFVNGWQSAESPRASEEVRTRVRSVEPADNAYMQTEKVIWVLKPKKS